MNVSSKAIKLNYLIDFSNFKLIRCLEKSQGIGSCGIGSEDKKQMLISDTNEPIIKLLIDGELSKEEKDNLKELCRFEQQLELNRSKDMINMMKDLIQIYHFDADYQLADKKTLL